MQIAMIAGNIGKDAELRNVGDNQVCQFNVAVDGGKDRNGNKRDSTWYQCSLWGKRGEALCQYLKKGGKVSVTGNLSCRVHEGKAYMNINVSELTLQGGNQSKSQSYDGNYGNERGGGQRSASQQSGARQDFDLDDDQIPF